MNPYPEANYEERIAPIKTETRSALIASAGERYRRCVQWYGENQSREVDIVNEMRLAGIEFNEAAGERHEQLTLNADGLAFCRAHILPQLPAGASLPFVRACLHLYRTMPGPAETYAQARPYIKQMELSLGAIEAVPRVQELHAPKSVFSAVRDDALRVQRVIRKLDDPRTWPERQRAGFLEDWQPLVEFYRAVERVRG